jgi:hypothetical protein
MVLMVVHGNRKETRGFFRFFLISKMTPQIQFYFLLTHAIVTHSSSSKLVTKSRDPIESTPSVMNHEPEEAYR